METAIKRAIEGGWNMQTAYITVERRQLENGIDELAQLSIHKVLLDPLFWQCLGKSLGWGSGGHNWDTAGTTCDYCGAMDGDDDPQPATGAYDKCWKYHWHRLIDALAAGKTADEYFNETLK